MARLPIGCPPRRIGVIVNFVFSSRKEVDRSAASRNLVSISAQIAVCRPIDLIAVAVVESHCRKLKCLGDILNNLVRHGPCRVRKQQGAAQRNKASPSRAVWQSLPLFCVLPAPKAGSQ